MQFYRNMYVLKNFDNKLYEYTISLTCVLLRHDCRCYVYRRKKTKTHHVATERNFGDSRIARPSSVALMDHPEIFVFLVIARWIMRLESLRSGDTFRVFTLLLIISMINVRNLWNDYSSSILYEPQEEVSYERNVYPTFFFRNPKIKNKETLFL